MLIDTSTHSWGSKDWFDIVPIQLIEDGFSPKAILLWVTIKNLSNKHGFCWAAQSFLREKVGISINSLPQYFKELCEEGWLLVVRNSGSNNHYFPLLNGRLCYSFHVSSRAPLKNWGEYSPKDGERVPPNNGGSLPPKRGVETSINETKKTEIGKTTTPVSCCCLSEELEEAIRVVAPTKRSAEGWEFDIRQRAERGLLNEKSLLSQAKDIKGNHEGETYKALVEKMIDRDGTERVERYIKTLPGNTVLVEGVKIDISYVLEIIHRTKSGRKGDESQKT